MKMRIVGVCGLLVGLAACTVPNGPTASTTASGNGLPAAQDDIYAPGFNQTMYELGVEYFGVVTHRDPQWTNQTIQNCYGSREAVSDPYFYQIPSHLDGLRWCMVLDYMAYKDNQVATHHYTRPGNPYLSLDTAAQRWAFWAPHALFSNGDAMFRYMRRGYSIAKPVEVGLLRNPALNSMGAIPQPGTKMRSFMGGT